MLEGKTILLAEDDSILSETYGKILKEEGAEVKRAVDGEEAIGMAIKFKPDAIILDIMMPKKNGFEVLGILKANEATKKIPVVICTVLSGDGNISKAKALGAADFWVKSEVMATDIAKRIKSIL